MIETVTILGTRALAQALDSSASITFTRCVIGTGAFDPSLDDPSEMEGLIAQAASVTVDQVRREDDGVAVVADMDNTVIPGGTAIREKGLYARLNDDAEFLFTYAYSDDPEIVPPAEEATYERRFVSHILMSDEEADLTVTYYSTAEAMSAAAEWRAAISAELEGKADSADLAPVAMSGSASDLSSGTLPADRISSIDVSKLDGVIDSSHLPSYVDDVLEYASVSAFPATGESGKIYVDIATNKTYRWSGSTYVEISESLALGTTESTAFRGDYGAAAYMHAVTNKGVEYASGLYKIATNAEGHITSAVAVTKADILSLGILPAGGTVGQSLVKSSAADYDMEWGNAGSQAPAAPTNLTATAGGSSATLKWNDPPESEYTNGSFAVWAGTIVVRKTGSAPQSPSDGTIVVASTVHDQYATNGYVDANLTTGTTYYYALFACSAGGAASQAAIVQATPSWSAVTFADATESEIATVIQKHYAGELNLSDIWNVGDTRVVPIAAMTATGVGESHVAQDAEIVLMDFDHYDLTATQKSALGTSRTKAAVVWGLKNFLANGTNGEWGYMESSNTNANGWHNSARRAWCQNVFKAALPSWLQSLLKQVNIVTATKGNARGTTTSTDYIFLPAEKEIFGTNTYANSSDESSLSQYDWYATAANRIKKAGAEGSADYWWERSPYGSNTTVFCFVSSDGTAGGYYASYARGVAPCGCF
ncbi:MAG: hypothetical protein IJ087_03040 [Eggerthellaceae bacterium]|nr:hypothetical protein [Eggerthellaceae bacterium]